MIIAGASAYARIIDFEPFATLRARSARSSWWTWPTLPAGGDRVSPSPVPLADAVTSTTHKTCAVRGRPHPVQGRTRQGDRQAVSREPRGTARARHRRQTVAFKEALDPSFRDYCGQVIRNAQALAAALGEHGFNIVSGGTDNHLMLVDLRNKDVTGKVAEKALDAAGITVNKNTVPKETQSPFITSGIRIGTAAGATRGMREREMQQIARLSAKSSPATVTKAWRHQSRKKYST